MSEIDDIVKRVAIAGDIAILFTGSAGSRADQFRTGLHAALESAVLNGLISVTPVADWPSVVWSTPPYGAPWDQPHEPEAER